MGLGVRLCAVRSPSHQLHLVPTPQSSFQACVAAALAWTLPGQMPSQEASDGAFSEQVKSVKGPLFCASRVIGSVWNSSLAVLERQL